MPVATATITTTVSALVVCVVSFSTSSYRFTSSREARIIWSVNAT